MGNDGGDIPRRKELVKDRTKQEYLNPDFAASAKAKFCNLTNRLLQEPLAIDKLGLIYNYQKLLEALIQKNLPEKYAYITKKSDIKRILVEKASSESDNFIVCPITKVQFNGFTRFNALWTCGHVYFEKAFKEINTENKKCPICEVEFQNSSVISLNLMGKQLEAKRKTLIEKKKEQEAKKKKKQNNEIKNEPIKKIKEDYIIGSMDKFDDEFRDLIRSRKNFKSIFTKQTG